MCGIGLWFLNNKNSSTSGFEAFMEVIKHRGPDAQNVRICSDQLIIGNNRLAIIDQDARSNQPMIYDNFTISFNGAIYNFKEIREELIQLGHIFHTESDTEVILHSFAEYGEQCVHQFDGMWSFVIYDEIRQSIFCSRDRFGIKPFYYLINDSGFYAGSEQKQFYKIDDFDPQIDPTMVAYFLDTGGFKNYSEKTFLKNIYQLLPGHNARFDVATKQFSIEQYYALSKSASPNATFVTDLIKQSVRERQIGDVRPGMMFSGGLDSSILLGHLLQSDHTVQSYSFIEQSNPNLDESPYISAFVRQYAHINHQITLPKRIEDIVRICIDKQDEPIASLSAVAQFLLYSLAGKNGEKLMISGQGADELFAGYPRNLSLISKWTIAKNPIAGLGFLLSNFDLIKNQLFSPSPIQLFTESISDVKRPNSVQEYMQALIENNGLRDLLHYEDSNSMANSIETRVPFLSHSLVEYAYHLDDEIKMAWLKRKGILLENYRTVLPKVIIDRKTKLAFDTPEQSWLDRGIFKIDQQWNILRERFTSLPWKDINPINLNHMTQWQIYFLNVYLDVHDERLATKN